MNPTQKILVARAIATLFALIFTATVFLMLSGWKT
jgi:hypothetical protein